MLSEKYLLVIGASLIAATALAQQGVAPAGNQPVYQRYAPVDLTGNWVSIVTEDWRERMITPKKGDYSSIPLNAVATKAADAWDPAHDASAGEACRGYSAPAVLRLPGRLHINWQDNGNTLRIDTDAGQQTRLLQFAGKEPQGEAGFQGYSAASWDYAGGFDPARVGIARAMGRGGANGPANAPAAGGNGGGGNGGGGGGGNGGGNGGGGGGGARGNQIPTTPQGGALKVVTTHLKPGYLRKNGVPYSKDAILTEYFNVHKDTDGTEWLIVTTIMHDLANLNTDYITSTNFRREADASKWRPQPCTAQ